MKELEDRILKEGRVLGDHIIKVDSFLNHQVDPDLLTRMGEELYRLYENDNVTKILTIEASGIPAAIMTASVFHVPCVFAKKHGAKNIDRDLYTTTVHSYTYDKDYVIAVSKQYLQAGDRILIVDDFLANGAAMEGLIDLAKQAGATIVGLAACIEKGFQQGGQKLREKGYRVTSLAIIDAIESGVITFR